MRKITLLFVLALALVLAIPGLAGQLVRTRHEALVGALAANFQHSSGGCVPRKEYRIRWQ